MKAAPEFDMGRGTRYVPVLRTKQAEWTALRQLATDVREAITPCLEVLPPERAKGPQKLMSLVE
jgi:Beta protein